MVLDVVSVAVEVAAAVVVAAVGVEVVVVVVEVGADAVEVVDGGLVVDVDGGVIAAARPGDPWASLLGALPVGNKVRSPKGQAGAVVAVEAGNKTAPVAAAVDQYGRPNLQARVASAAADSSLP